MKSYVIIFLILYHFTLSVENLHAQYVSKSDKRNNQTKNKSLQREGFGQKIRFGGNIGAGFGDPTFVDLSPTIGYQVSEKLEFGLGPSYAFYRFRNDNFKGDDHLYGGRVYGQLQVYKGLSFRAEIESMNVGLGDTLLSDQAVKREWQLAPLVGANVQFKFLEKINLQFTLLYNPLHEDGKSWRNTPWVTRFGFGL